MERLLKYNIFFYYYVFGVLPSFSSPPTPANIKTIALGRIRRFYFVYLGGFSQDLSFRVGTRTRTRGRVNVVESL